VVEADESDASFLNLLPVMAVVTNIDADHMETYGHDFGRLKKAFVDFLHRMPFYGSGRAVHRQRSGARHPASGVLPGHQLWLFGGSPGACASTCAPKARKCAFHRAAAQRRHAARPGQCVLNLAGEHNVQNALAAIAVAVELNIPDAAVLRALEGFRGVGRRFQSYGDLPAKDGGHFT
jgi:UDP-N-acetylmuramate--alanine ligase